MPISNDLTGCDQAADRWPRTLLPFAFLAALATAILLSTVARAEQEAALQQAQPQQAPAPVQQREAAEAPQPKGKGAEQPPVNRPAETEAKPVLTGAADLKQRSMDAYLHGRFEEAAALNLKIARKYPASKECHYAVQMLATIYETNLPDVKKSLQWNKEFLKRFADSRQAPFYKEKVERMEKLLPPDRGAAGQASDQEAAYKAYQKIKFANKGDGYLVKNYQALLKTYPDFMLKVEVQKEIAYAYDRMNRPKESYATLQAIAAETPGHKLSSTDQIMAETNHSYWEMTTTWKWFALALVALLWGAVLLVKPWKRLDRVWVRRYLLWTLGWVLLIASRMPTFYSMETEGYQFVITDNVIYTMAAWNLPVILWLLLFNRGEFWLTRPRALRWVSPLLTLVMTVSVLYLFIAFEPNGPAIVSVFGPKYQYLLGELRTKGHL
jgi:hypothetical protein